MDDKVLEINNYKRFNIKITFDDEKKLAIMEGFNSFDEAMIFFNAVNKKK